jgi:cobalt/nickel transport protein
VSRKPPTRVVVLAGLAVALLLAGVASFYASSRPDGLNRVAEDHGFAQTQQDHRAADGTFAGYETKGIGNGRLSGGLAGVVGSVVVLSLTGGITYAVRRRRTAGDRVTSDV